MTWRGGTHKLGRRIAAGANCVLGIKICLLHSQKLDIGDEIYSTYWSCSKIGLRPISMGLHRH
jgi:hypothetical protein